MKVVLREGQNRIASLDTEKLSGFHEENGEYYVVLGRDGGTADVVIAERHVRYVSREHARLWCVPSKGRWYIQPLGHPVAVDRETLQRETKKMLDVGCELSFGTNWHTPGPLHLHFEAEPSQEEIPSSPFVAEEAISTLPIGPNTTELLSSRSKLFDSFPILEDLARSTDDSILEPPSLQEIGEKVFSLFRTAFSCQALEVVLSSGHEKFSRTDGYMKAEYLKEDLEYYRTNPQSCQVLAKAWPKERGYVRLCPHSATRGLFTDAERQFFELLFLWCGSWLGVEVPPKRAQTGDALVDGYIQASLSHVTALQNLLDGKGPLKKFKHLSDLAVLPFVLSAYREETQVAAAKHLSVTDRGLRLYIERVKGILGEGIVEQLFSKSPNRS
ncbi:MAG: FHA domain-containing protein [Myxococcales bacterium]|nr:FHA domain-containing protein [Myxococcales bacterium]